MVGRHVEKLTGFVLLMMLSMLLPCSAQQPAMRRLPPCYTDAPRTVVDRPFPPIVQVASLQAIAAPEMDPAGAGSQVGLGATGKNSAGATGELLQPAPGSLPPPEHLMFEPQLMFDEYLIQPGDELEIKFRFTPELNEIVTVRPDGMISLQIVGAVMAADRTPRELHAELVEAFTPALKNPKIVVLVRRFAGNHVFVGGEVATPSRIPIAGQLSVLQAIIRAGGFKDTADVRRVILRRDGGYSVELNLKCDLKGHVVSNDVILRPYDVVYVPKSRIAKVNQFVDQYIEKLLPFSRSAGIFVTKEVGQ
jgi:polysaccharide export outer membrane protein